MSNVYITEYRRKVRPTEDRYLPLGDEPALDSTRVPSSGTSAQSAAFNKDTEFIRVHTDGIVSIRFGSNPTATTSDRRLAADQTEYFGVNPGDKLAVIDNT